MNDFLTVCTNKLVLLDFIALVIFLFSKIDVVAFCLFAFSTIH